LALDPRSPVLVGAGVASRREADPALALEPVALMLEAVRAAGDDAGAAALLACADVIAVPRGFWSYPDPARWLAERIGAATAKTWVAEIGVLQTTLFAEAARAIREGGADVVLVVGGEARYRAQRAKAAGQAEQLSAQAPGTTPDRVMRPAHDIVHPVEIARGFVVPVQQYALIDNAMRRADGQTIDAHRRAVSELWAGYARVAAANPHAWNRTAPDAAALADLERNPPLAFPYGKLHCSQWNVDQAAALLFCSAERARRAGIPEAGWVHPRAVAESNEMRPLVSRASLGRSPGFACAGRKAFALAGLEPKDVALRELYSCFPAAVRLQLREIGLAPEPTPSWTGGMTFGGGPLNNFVLQAAARMLGLLREQGGSALLTAVSGMLTKQGVSLWSCEPGERGFAYADVSGEAAAVEPSRPVVDGVASAGTLAGYSVLYENGAPSRCVAVVDLDGGARTLAASDDRELAARGVDQELAGLRVRVEADGRLVA
jgi:acetyl-CoA C-acetyltransferase